MTRRIPPPDSWIPLDPLDVPLVSGSRVEVPAGERRLVLDWIGSGVVRLCLVEPGQEPPEFSWAVVSRPAPAGSLAATEDAGGVSIRGPGCEVRIDAATGALSFRGDDGTPFLETLPRGGIELRGAAWRARFRYPDGERTFGLGEKSGRMDKRGAVLRMWNTDSFLYERLTDPLYMSIPFWTGLRDGRAHGMFVDDAWPMVLDAGATERHVFTAAAEGGACDVYVIAGPAPRDVIARYTALTGRPARPPRWALGFQQCRYSYFPEARVLELARAFRERRIPGDVIWLDIHHLDRFRSFTWDPERFPDPARLLAELHALGFRVVTISDPGLRAEPGYAPYDSGLAAGHFVRTPDGEVALGRVWPGICAFPDFTAAAARAWWGGLYAGIVRDGVDGFWNDMNEPSVFGGPGGTLPADLVHEGDAGRQPHVAVHNVYGQEMARATRDGIARLRPDRRPFVLTRAGFAGVQRVAAGWSGDNASTWEDLRLSIPMALNMGASGQPLFGADLGGFGGAPAAELFTRWLQAGAFMGLMRVHSCFGTPDQEPWSFGPEWEARNRAAIETRYRLLPYLESLFDEAVRTGMPPVRPPWMEWPEAETLAGREDIFLLGPSLLVAPVLEPGASRRVVPLPPGRWFTFPDGRPLALQREVTLDAPLEAIPVLARGGAIVPWADPAQHTGEPLDRTLLLKAFAGGDGAFVLFEDDGDGPADGSGPARRTPFSLETGNGRHRLVIGAATGDHPGRWSRFRIAWHGLEAEPGEVTWTGAGSPDGDGSWSWDAGLGVLVIEVGAAALPVAIEVPAGAVPEPARILEVPGTATIAGDPARGVLVLDGPEHRPLPAWWKPLPLRAVVAAAWTPRALLLDIRLTAEHPWRPGFNAQDDGLWLVFGVPGPDAGPVRRFRLPAPWEGGPPLVETDHLWLPAELVDGAATLEGPETGFALTIQPRALGLDRFAAGQSCAFDFAVQVSDAEGRRGLLEWSRAHSDPASPGGRLVLA